MQPLAPFQKDVTVLGLGLRNDYDCWKATDFDAGGHSSYPQLLTGAWPKIVGKTAVGNSISVDQYVANVYAEKAPTKFKSLVMGTFYHYDDDNGKSVSYREPAIGNKPDVVVPEVNPYTMWTNIFAGGVADTPGLDPTALAKLRARRKSVLDYVRGRIARLQGRLAKDDAESLQAHLESLRQLEVELTNVSPASCAVTKLADGLPWNKGAQLDKVVPVQVDLAALALRCNPR